jgi:chromate transporter
MVGEAALTPPSSLRTPLSEIASLFLKLGTTAFGGPAAHIAMMEDEVVRRRGWLTREEFLDYLGATNLIPGPNSTELAIHVGYARAGWPGLLVAGTCFILPAALIVTAIAWSYVRFGALPQVTAVLYGVKPVVIAVVLQALWGLGRSALRTRALYMIGAASTAAVVLGVNELAVLFAAGGVAAIVAARRANGPVDQWGDRAVIGSIGLSPFARAATSLTATAAGSAIFGLWPLFLTFLKIGSVLFGSGYVLLAFLRADFVDRLGWLTERQLLDAVAVGQLTPGPVFTTATFIGYVLGGGKGAAVATVGIFVPAFVFVAASGFLLPYLRRSQSARAFLDGVNVASLALMAVVTWQLTGAALTDAVADALAIVAALLLFRWRINTAWLILGAGVIGWMTHSG